MNKREFKLSVIIIAMISLILACQKSSIPEIEIVAKAGEDFLTRDELFRWMPPTKSEDEKEIIARLYIDRWIQKTTMALSAKNEGISLSPYEKWSLQNLHKEMLAQKYLDAKLPKEIIVTDEEISTFYKENKDQFIRNYDEVHLVQLFLESRDRAISAEIRELKSLMKVIQKNYLDQQSNRLIERNGDLGYVPIKNLRKEIVRTARTGSTGRIYGPIQIENGYYYFQMMDKQNAGTYRSLDLVKEEVKMRLEAIKRDQLAQELGEKLTNGFKVEVFPEHIK
jgi:hypothetical protein